jgi:hypothetical protein
VWLCWRELKSMRGEMSMLKRERIVGDDQICSSSIAASL